MLFSKADRKEMNIDKLSRQSKLNDRLKQKMAEDENMQQLQDEELRRREQEKAKRVADSEFQRKLAEQVAQMEILEINWDLDFDESEDEEHQFEDEGRKFDRRQPIEDARKAASQEELLDKVETKSPELNKRSVFRIGPELSVQSKFDESGNEYSDYSSEENAEDSFRSNLTSFSAFDVTSELIDISPSLQVPSCSDRQPPNIVHTEDYELDALNPCTRMSSELGRFDLNAFGSDGDSVEAEESEDLRSDELDDEFDEFDQIEERELKRSVERQQQELESTPSKREEYNVEASGNPRAIGQANDHRSSSRMGEEKSSLVDHFNDENTPLNGEGVAQPTLSESISKPNQCPDEDDPDEKQSPDSSNEIRTSSTNEKPNRAIAGSEPFVNEQNGDLAVFQRSESAAFIERRMESEIDRLASRGLAAGSQPDASVNERRKSETVDKPTVFNRTLWQVF